MVLKYKKQQWNACMHLTSSSDTINTLMNKSNYINSLRNVIHKNPSNTQYIKNFLDC